MKDDELIVRFEKLGWIFHRYHIRNRQALGPMGDPYRGQGKILSLLKVRPEMSQRDLSCILGIRPQSLGELLSKLEKDGYIERETSETDRRAMEIRLTEKGRTIVAEREIMRENLFSCLDDTEKEQLNGYLQKITDRMSEMIQEDINSDNRQTEERNKFLKDDTIKLTGSSDGTDRSDGP